MEIVLEPGKKLYFVSDCHLGIPTHALSLQREKLLVSWLENKKSTAQAFFLLGDIFEFWFEYRKVVPKGFVRLLGKLAEITDSGVPVYFFTGNHDIWTFGYLRQEVGLKIYRETSELFCNGKTFLIGHGDGLGPGDLQYKRAKRIYNSVLMQKIFAAIHPDTGINWASKFSKTDRYTNGSRKDIVVDPVYERLVLFCRQYLENRNVNYFVFGHRHTPCDIQLTPQSRYINTGDWINHYSYASFDGTDLSIHRASVDMLR